MVDCLLGVLVEVNITSTKPILFPEDIMIDFYKRRPSVIDIDSYLVYPFFFSLAVSAVFLCKSLNVPIFTYMLYSTEIFLIGPHS